MNDDLEQELHALQPAAPPSALRRRLRAQPPREHRSWWQRFPRFPGRQEAVWWTVAGTAAAVILMLPNIALPTLRSPGSTPLSQGGSSRKPLLPATDPTAFKPPVHGMRPPGSGSGAVLTPTASSGTLLEPGGLRVDFGPGYTASAAAALPANGLDREFSTCAVSLDCGGLQLVNDGTESVFERLALPVRSRF